MYFVYVLKSLNHEFYYKGHCQDIEARLAQHNAGLTTSTKPYRPFKVVYSEAFESHSKAIAREKYFKSAEGRRFLKTVISIE